MAKKPKVTLSHTLHDKAEGPPSEYAEKVALYGYGSSAAVLALLGIWVIQAGPLLDIVLGLIAAAGVVSGLVAIFIARSELEAIRRGHSPVSGKARTSIGNGVAMGSVGGALVLVLLMLVLGGSPGFHMGTGDLKWPETTYDTWVEALEKDSIVQFAKCWHGFDLEAVDENQDKVRAYVERTIELNRLNTELARKKKDRRTKLSAAEKRAMEKEIKKLIATRNEIKLSKSLADFAEKYKNHRKMHKDGGYGSPEVERIDKSNARIRTHFGTKPSMLKLRFDKGEVAWKIVGDRGSQ